MEKKDIRYLKQLIKIYTALRNNSNNRFEQFSDSGNIGKLSYYAGVLTVYDLIILDLEKFILTRKK